MVNNKKELQRAYQNMMRKQKIEIHLVNLNRRLKIYEREEEKLLRIVDKEEDDYLKMERMNVRSLFLKVLGTREEELEKERQDYLMAILKHRDCVKNISSLKFEQEVLQKQLSGLHNSEAEFEALFKKIGQHLELKLSAARKQKIKEVDLRILNHEARIKEIREAKTAGKKAERVLERITEDLSKVMQWGNTNIKKRNTMRGQGSGSSRSKKRFIDNARREVNRANILLEHFETEIQDIQKHFKIDYRNYIKSFDDFLDIFYDNLITDWIVKKNVKNTSFAIQTIHDKVVRILAMLENEIQNGRDFIKEENLLRKQIIIQGEK